MAVRIAEPNGRMGVIAPHTALFDDVKGNRVKTVGDTPVGPVPIIANGGQNDVPNWYAVVMPNGQILWVTSEFLSHTEIRPSLDDILGDFLDIVTDQIVERIRAKVA